MDEGIKNLEYQSANDQKGIESKDVDKVFEKFNKCTKDCTHGAKEIFKMQKRHAEVTRLTYSRNIARCLEIHADGATSAESLPMDNGVDDPNSKVKWAELANCIEHNTDKVDRRFFGYYPNQKSKLIDKYCKVQI